MFRNRNSLGRWIIYSSFLLFHMNVNFVPSSQSSPYVWASASARRSMALGKRDWKRCVAFQLWPVHIQNWGFNFWRLRILPQSQHSSAWILTYLHPVFGTCRASSPFEPRTKHSGETWLFEIASLCLPIIWSSFVSSAFSMASVCREKRKAQAVGLVLQIRHSLQAFTSVQCVSWVLLDLQLRGWQITALRATPPSKCSLKQPDILGAMHL